MRYRSVALAGLIPAVLGMAACSFGSGGDRPSAEYATKEEVEQLRTELKTTRVALGRLWQATTILAGHVRLDTVTPPKCRPPKCTFAKFEPIPPEIAR
jgi:hypothetical protein